MKVLIAALTLAGCGLVVIACAMPYAQYCDPATCIANFNPGPSLIRDDAYHVSWLITAPALGLVLVLAIAAATAVITLGAPIGRWMASGVLVAAGAMLLAFFVGMLGMGTIGRPAWNLGAFGGVLVTLAGLAPVYKSMRQRLRSSDREVIN